MNFIDRAGTLLWRGGGQTLLIEPWGENSLRVRATLQREILDTEHALLPQPATGSRVHIDGATATVTNGRITAVATASTGEEHVVGYPVHRCHLAFYNEQGDLLLEELDPGGSLRLDARELRPHLGGDLAITARFAADPVEKLYGMGQYQQDAFDLKGCTLELAHRNSQASVPFVLSNRGYGFLWHNPAIGTATFGRNRTEWHAGVSDQLDYWITAGGSPAQILRSYTAVTGRVPMMPEYGLGFWQSKLRYWNQEQLLEVVREHTARGLPLDVVVADFFHWPHMGDFRFDEEFWPDPAAMLAELREHGVELMVSVWPQVSLHSENYDRLAADNLLVRTERGIGVQMAFEEPSMFLDVTNPEARQWVWDTCRRNYEGVRLFWLDEAEPEYGIYDFDNYRYHLGPNVKIGNRYPQLYSRAFYEGQRAAGQEEVVNLVRCAWAGSQRYGALAWSGDIGSTWTDLRRQITAGIHMGVAGIAWFTTDIGGFHLGDINDEDFRELFVRWFQFGAFCPVMRLHGDRLPYEEVTAGDGSRRLRSGAPNELWSYGERAYPILERYVHLREALRPYLREVMATAHREGQPVMRGLFHDFPADSRAWDVADQYLLGPDLLVAPVLEPGARSREVYLPAGARWTDAATGQEHDGGGWVTAQAPLDVVPVFLRDGALPHLVGRTTG